MSSQNILPNHFSNFFLNNQPLIDVRAPVEFAKGRLPNSINLPILNDDERALIGTTFKKQGREQAINLGFEIISGTVKKQRLSSWQDYLYSHSNAVIYCYRGGLRSQITQQWLKESGIEVPLIVGGYKASRNYLIEKTSEFTIKNEFLLISGATGSGKTRLLDALKKMTASIDLEDLACHRGSAFGAMKKSQPTQTDFENKISIEMLKLESKNNYKKILVEDESRLIGKNAIPKIFFDKMRSSKVVWVEESIDARVERIHEDYILHSNLNKSELFDQYKNSVTAISKKLGGLRAQELISLMTESEHHYKQTGLLESNKIWIKKLLIYYYDPLYLDSIKKRQVVIEFKGSLIDCEQYLRQSYRNR